MNARHWLMISAVVNVALAGGLGWYVLSPATCCAPVEPAPDDPQSAASALTSAAPTPAKGARIVTITNRVEAGFAWRQVESEDYKEYIANLRAIGCPEETIRDIIIADVDKLFADRRREMRAASTNKFEYWKASANMLGMPDEKRLAEYQKLAKERRDLLTQLLGTFDERLDMTAMWGGGTDANEIFDFLTPAQQQQVMETEQKYNAKLMTLWEDAGGGIAAGDETKWQAREIMREKNAELAKLLSPEELESYQLRLSETATVMRFQLTSFDPSEQEFIEIFRARNPLLSEFGQWGPMPGNQEEQARHSAVEALQEKTLKSVLGDRYADYERSHNMYYNQFHLAAKKTGIARESIVSVWDMRQAAQHEATNVRNDSSLTAEQRNAALRAIADETARSVRQTLGDDAFKTFQQNNTASGWLNELAP